VTEYIIIIDPTIGSAWILNENTKGYTRSVIKFAQIRINTILLFNLSDANISIQNDIAVKITRENTPAIV
jgi:hypothetical protein